MEGPMDATSGGQEDPTRVAEGSAGPGRRPTGKALQRLLYFLEERGYVGVAEAAIESAAGQNGSEVRERATPVLVIQSDLRLRLDRYRLSYLRPSLSQKGPGRKADRFRVLDR
jgi:hypothetical protein